MKGEEENCLRGANLNICAFSPRALALQAEQATAVVGIYAASSAPI